ncbi:hypothetical protein V6N11_026673 [Hibiscus sabdariffa]|uniref:RING-type domain-containing protein n=1 Tax=Hibiscus sabdariffa TaxID=183260 RepID=A0ABR2SWD0_9ROSI
MESKQLTLNEAAQPLKDPAGLSKKSEISRIGTLIQSVKKKNKETAQPVSISAGLVNNGFDDCIVPLEKSCQNPAENVLSCGHAFHSQCLRLTIAEEKIRDPPCIICASILS